ncbi:MAG: GNAT family N-acetyltransferase [bacterium]|nr:GNAT family N-acetyltransferase [bacterium]
MTKEELIAALKERNIDQTENGFFTIFDSSFDLTDEVLELIYSTVPHSVENRYDQAMKDFDFYRKLPHRLLAYLHQNKLIGLIGYAKNKQEGVYSIIPLIIQEEHRFKGYAQLFLDYIEQLLLSQGAIKLQAVLAIPLTMEASLATEVIPFLRNGYLITYIEKLVEDGIQVISVEKHLSFVDPIFNNH